MRAPLICGNWKMHKTLDEARSFAAAFAGLRAGTPGGAGEVVLFPAFPFLAEVVAALGPGAGVAVGAQACHPEPEGAYTGAVSCEMIASTGARWVLCGHSERRRVFGEEDGEINLQVRAALGTGLSPILCIGETREERERERTRAVLTQQLVLGLEGFNVREIGGLTIAYEPVWAIGTGLHATPDVAASAHRFIRETLGQRFNDEAAQRMRILYGGSVKPGNAAELMAEGEVDGLLVGGASLDPAGFHAIVRAASA